MELRRLRRHVINRGGLCDAWLVYAEYPAPETHAPVPRPRLVRAFWSRAEAVDWALEQRAERHVPRYEVYHVPLDEVWIAENTLRPATHVSLHGNGPERPAVAVTPGAISHAFG